LKSCRENYNPPFLECSPFAVYGTAKTISQEEQGIMPAEKTEMVMKNYHDRVRLPRKGLEKGDDTTTGATQKKPASP